MGFSRIADWINEIHRIIPHVGVEVGAVGEAGRIRGEEPPDRRIIPSCAEVEKAARRLQTFGGELIRQTLMGAQRNPEGIGGEEIRSRKLAVVGRVLPNPWWIVTERDYG